MNELNTAYEWLKSEIESDGGMIDAAIEQMQEAINYLREQRNG